jgi:hypothetical protein
MTVRSAATARAIFSPASFAVGLSLLTAKDVIRAERHQSGAVSLAGQRQISDRDGVYSKGLLRLFLAYRHIMKCRSIYDPIRADIPHGDRDRIALCDIELVSFWRYDVIAWVILDKVRAQLTARTN